MFIGDYLNILQAGSHRIDDTLSKIKVKYMSAEERKKHEIIEQQKLEYREQQKKKQDYIKLMQKQSEEDRLRKAEQKSKTSVAN